MLGLPSEKEKNYLEDIYLTTNYETEESRTTETLKIIPNDRKAIKQMYYKKLDYCDFNIIQPRSEQIILKRKYST
jgi:hypothetical protein